MSNSGVGSDLLNILLLCYTGLIRYPWPSICLRLVNVSCSLVQPGIQTFVYGPLLNITILACSFMLDCNFSVVSV
jgi:hypothetical protein